MIPLVVILVWLLSLVVLSMLCVAGRRVGTDPHCPKCNFNLRGVELIPFEPGEFGLDAPRGGRIRCTDCGEVYPQPRRLPKGERHPRPRCLVALGVLILVPAIGVVTVGARSGWTFDLYQAMPTSLLVQLAHGHGDRGQEGASKELEQRMMAASFTDAERADIARVTLEAHEGIYRRSEIAGFPAVLQANLDAAVENRWLDRDELQRAFQLAFSVRVIHPLEVRAGSVIPLRLFLRVNEDLYPSPPGGQRLYYRTWRPWSLESVVVNGQKLLVQRATDEPISAAVSVLDVEDPRLRRAIADLPPGKYESEWTFTIAPPIADLPTEYREIWEDYGLDLGEYTQTLRCQITVIDPGSFGRPERAKIENWDRIVRSPYWSEDPYGLEFLRSTPKREDVPEGAGVPFEVLHVLNQKEHLLGFFTYGARPRNYANFDDSKLLRVNDDFREKIEGIEKGGIILRSTRRSERYMSEPLRVLVPPYEAVYEYDPSTGYAFTGFGSPNPLAEELGFVPGTGEAAGDEPEADD